MVTINLGDARENLSGAIDTAKSEAVFLESHGHPVAVLISPERHAELTAAFEEPEDVEAFDAAMVEKGPSLLWEQAISDLGWS